jgi:formylglycine-generating enzyme required for sulfatase activity
MGSATGRPDERPIRDVEISPFRLGLTPVTNAQYAAAVDAGRVPPPPSWDDPALRAPDQPVVGVTWFEARDFAGWLAAQTDRPFRLPTEAEWERAARGGLPDAPTAWGDALPADEVPRGPLPGPWPAGRGTPNGYGLLDMGTIVHEWCADRYGPYDPADVSDPRGRVGDRRSSRGGSWRHHVRFSPPSARSSLLPGFRYTDYGFRVACGEGAWT